MNVEIAQRLAARRKQAGLSQESLAERLGVSRQAVSKWERSESSPDTDNLIALAQLYGVSLDELLYVDDAIEDDMAFESVDRATERTEGAAVFSDVEAERAAKRTGEAGGDVADAQEADAADAPVGGAADAFGASASSAGPADPSKVRIGFDGIHVEDGEDYVHVSWRDGVHVIDGKKGEEVHVGWNGIHVKEPRAARTREASTDGAESREGSSAGECCGAADMHVNHGHSCSWGDWRYPKVFEKTWMRFPYPLVVILAYVLLGIANDAWGMGLFLFLTIPLYYMIGHALAHRRIAPLIAGAYPLAAVAWFCYRAFVMNEPHPAWVVFLTIPLVEWLVHGIAGWWRARKRRRKSPSVIEVEGR